MKWFQAAKNSVILVSLLLQGCSSFDLSKNLTKRSEDLLIAKKFVKPTTESSILRYRKIFILQD